MMQWPQRDQDYPNLLGRLAGAEKHKHDAGHLGGLSKDSPGIEVPVFARQEALALQRDLLERFRLRRFRVQLRALQEHHLVQSTAFKLARRDLIRSAQYGVLPSYGFELSERGVQNMLAAVSVFLGDHRVASNARAIDGLIRLTRSSKTQGTACTSQLDAHSHRLNVCEALQMQAELYKKFSAGKFQRCLRDLEQEHLQREPHFRAARQQLVLSVQRAVLPQYGFKASEEGVRDMLAEFARFSDDAEVTANKCSIDQLLRGARQRSEMSTDRSRKNSGGTVLHAITLMEHLREE